MLLIADIVYKENIALNSVAWRSGEICFLSNFVVLLFSFSTQSFTLFLSVSRLMVVSNALTTKFKDTHFVKKWLVSLGMLALLSSLLFYFILKLTLKSLPTNLCLPFVDPNKSIIFNVALFIVFITQTTTSIIISILHVLLVKSYNKSQEKVKTSKSGKSSSKPIIIQLVIITMSIILCWFPTNIIFVFAMFAERYSTDLIMWTIICGMPIYSIVMPVVFCIMHLRGS